MLGVEKQLDDALQEAFQYGDRVLCEAFFTGKEVAAGAADGSIEAYYKLQQDNFIAAGAVEKEVPVSDYVMLDNMIEAGK